MSLKSHEYYCSCRFNYVAGLAAYKFVYVYYDRPDYYNDRIYLLVFVSVITIDSDRSETHPLRQWPWRYKHIENTLNNPNFTFCRTDVNLIVDKDAVGMYHLPLV